MSITFNEIVFGPIKSRRFGISLGINLLPLDNKVCNFNCIYCECGWTDLKSFKVNYFSAREILHSIETKFREIQEKKIQIDSVTFAGNGEPTMHPQFSTIIDEVIRLRNIYLKGVKITVLSNSTLLGVQSVFDSLKKIDAMVMKLDAGTTDMLVKIDKPLSSRKIDWYIDKLVELGNTVIIQTIFLKGNHEGQYIDNTAPDELEAWLRALKKIRPKSVMIYTIDRETPAKDLEKIPTETLESICNRVKNIGLEAKVYT